MTTIERRTIKKNHIICMIIIVFQWINGQLPPDEFEFSQSTLQAFYFFTDVTLNGELIGSDDWVAAFKGDVCVGARQFYQACGGAACDVPAMGNDGSEYTTGYMLFGDIPTFKIYDASSGNFYDAITSVTVDPWSVNGFSMNNLLEANAIISGCMEIDACNYDPNATISGICDFAEEGYDCDGNCIVIDGSCLSIENTIFENFTINNIYPNPFNPVVNIDLSIDIVAPLKLSVFTIEGIQIKTIYNGPSAPGKSTFTWKPENIASGFYFIRAAIDDQVKTQKILFLK